MSPRKRLRPMGFEIEQAPRMMTGVDSGSTLLGDLARIAIAETDSRAAALRCLEATADALGAASGFIALATGPVTSDQRLEIVAMVGPHAPLLGDASRMPTSDQTDVAVVYTTCEARYVDSVYDSSEDPTDGTARWRGLISAQATALLPIGTGDGCVGVMMLEWSRPQTFTREVRDLLESASLISALVIERTGRVDDVAPPAPSGPPAVVGRAPSSTQGLRSGEIPVLPVSTADEAPLRFEITPEGLVLPRSEDDAWGPSGVRVSLPLTRRAGVLVDVHPIASGRVLLLLAAIEGCSATQSEELVEMLRHTARVLGVRMETAGVIEAAAQRLRELGGIAIGLDAWIGVWDAATGSLHQSQHGRAGSRLLTRDGRDLEGDAAGTSVYLPLAGDVLHAWLPEAASMRAEWL